MVSFTDNIQRSDLNVIHDIVRKEECFAHDLMFFNLNKFDFLKVNSLRLFAFNNLIDLFFVNFREVNVDL